MANGIVSFADLDSPQNGTEWDANCFNKFSNLLITNNRLSAIVKKLGYKAAFGVAAALTELIHLRSKTYFPNVGFDQEFAWRFEALWASTIDPNYLKSFKFENRYFDENEVLTPHSANWSVIRHMAREYTKGSFYIHRYLINLSMLARHLVKDKKMFDNWFAEMIRKTVEAFPCSYDYADLDFDNVLARYDCSADAPVPREFFFDPEFEYSEEAAKPVLNTFLKSLDYENNPWLCTPEEMLEKGFKGTPYEV